MVVDLQEAFSHTYDDCGFGDQIDHGNDPAAPRTSGAGIPNPPLQGLVAADLGVIHENTPKTAKSAGFVVRID